VGFYNSLNRVKWRRFTSTHRCVVCGRPKLCSVTDDGSTVWCARVASERPRKSGIADGWLHSLTGDDGARVKSWKLPEIPLAQRAGALDVRDVVYRELLSRLTLSAEHRTSLRKRGLTDDQIDAGEYRSLPAGSRTRIGKLLSERFTEGQLVAVPGLFRREGRWTVGGAPGMVVPVRTLTGQVSGCKIRVDGDCDGGRYRYMTSSSHGGARAEMAVHVPVWAPDSGALYVTEGELKADVACALLGECVIGIPGVSQWKLGCDVALSVRPERVIVAMDMDRGNPAVATAQEQLIKTLRAAGLRVGGAKWDPRDKGLDDHLLNRRAVAA
jgi:hypothetical protein